MKEKEEIRFPPLPLKEHLEFQDFTGFRPSFTPIWKMLNSLGEKVAKNEKLQFLAFR